MSGGIIDVTWSKLLISGERPPWMAIAIIHAWVGCPWQLPTDLHLGPGGENLAIGSLSFTVPALPFGIFLHWRHHACTQSSHRWWPLHWGDPKHCITAEKVKMLLSSLCVLLGWCPFFWSGPFTCRLCGPSHTHGHAIENVTELLPQLDVVASLAFLRLQSSHTLRIACDTETLLTLTCFPLLHCTDIARMHHRSHRYVWWMRTLTERHTSTTEKRLATF